MEEVKTGTVPTLTFLPKAFEAMIEFLKGSITGKDPIIDFKVPEELCKLVKFGVPEEAETDEKIL